MPFWVLPRALVSGGVHSNDPLQIHADSHGIGAGLLQSLVVMPALRPHEGRHALSSIQHAAALLQKSERFFPPLNIASEACNLLALVVSFLYRHDCSVAGDKFSILAIALCFYVSITAYVFRVMIPMNSTILELRCKLEKEPDDEKSVDMFKRIQEQWRQRNFGRRNSYREISKTGS